MKRIIVMGALIALAAGTGVHAAQSTGGASIKGKVVDDAGNPMYGVLVTASDEERNKRITAYTQMDGTYELQGLRAADHEVRIRLFGWLDDFQDVDADELGSAAVDFEMEKADEFDLQLQRTADSLITMLKWDNKEDELNFRMNCTYCHQVGTIGFRTPEEPVDWEVMVTRMDGFGGLYPHTKEVIVDKLVKTYTLKAEERWPVWEPPAPIQGEGLGAKITEWDMGKEDDAMIHDLEIGLDGNIYIVDMINDAIIKLDPLTDERTVYSVPGGKEFDSTDVPTMGPHSIEVDANGNMWLTLALGGKMAKFDPKTEEWTVVSSSDRGARGMYPHTLRIAQDQSVWYTDAAMNSVFRLDQSQYNETEGTYPVKRYRLPRPEAADTQRTAVRGEGGAITPYGIAVAPDGMIWYTKLNGQRLGRINPQTDEISEWLPPIHGPRRHEIAPDGIVWVPGFGSGDLGAFDPKTEEWKVWPVHGQDGAGIPYALNVDPNNGDIWICGTGSDTMVKFDPKTEEMVVLPMPTRVTYTREIEFDKDGNIWTCNSNFPARHIENRHGSVIKIELP